MELQVDHFKNHADAFEHILENFDFVKVQDVMGYLNWQWVSVGVPYINDMIKMCRNLFQSAYQEWIEDDHWNLASSGGFEVFVDKNYVELKFVLTEMFDYLDIRNE